MTSSVCVVWPKKDGEITYRGFRWSFTCHATSDGMKGDAITCMEIADTYIAMHNDPNIEFSLDACKVVIPGAKVTTTYKIARVEEDEKIIYKLKGRKMDGTDWDYPKPITSPQAIAMLEKALHDAGFDPEQWKSGAGQLINIEFASKQSNKLMPKKKADDPDQYYTDYLSFKVLES